MQRSQVLEGVKPLLDVGDVPDSRLRLLVDSAFDLVEGYCKREFSKEVPATVLRVVAVITQRALDSAGTAPVGLTQLAHGAGPFNESFSFAPGANDGGVWLTKVDKLKLKRWRNSGAFTIRTW